jgi:hypothetical protein
VTASDISDLQRAGWARYDRTHFASQTNGSAFAASLATLQASYDELPADRYEPEANRFRRHARAVFLPWSGQLSWVPSVEDEEHGHVVDYAIDNPEFAGAKRQFPAISPDILEDPLLRAIIEFDMEQTSWFKRFRGSPLHVGVGCVRLSVCNPGDQAVATPNALHQDGGSMSFGFIHLIARRNVRGGENFVASPRCVGFRPEELSPDLLDAEFTLEEPLDTFAVHDARVSHYVSPVRRGDQPGPGERDILLVGTAPLVRQL